MKKRLISVICSLTFLFTIFSNLYIPVSAAISFSDVNGHWAKDYIYYGVEKGYLNGYSDGTFQPDKTVTRAEFSKMINSALGISNQAENTFVDVVESKWYYNEVCKAVSAGYITGYNETTFAPENNITRQEAAVILSRIIPKASTIKTQNFKDSASIASWATNAVGTVYSKGYMSGNDLGNFDPQGNLTRAQAAKIIGEIIKNELIESTDQTVAASTTFSGRLFTNDVTIAASVGNGSVTFTNCRILGKLEIIGAGTETVTLDGTSVSSISVSKTSGDVKLVAKGDSAIKETTLINGASIEENSVTAGGFQKVILSGNKLAQDTVSLNGNFDEIDISTSAVVKAQGGTIKTLNIEGKSTLILQSGTITTLNVDKEAENSSIALGDNVTVDTANIKVNTVFTGTGKIKTAVQGVSNISYETQPDKISGVTTNTSGTLAPVFSPGNAATGVKNTAGILLTFDEVIYKAGGGTISSVYLTESVIELRKNSITGTKVDFTAGINSTKKIVTITPSETLDNSTRYYVIVLKGSIQNADNETNPAYSSYFTTASTSQITASISPDEGTVDVALDSTVKVTFNQAIYQDEDATAITPAYMVNQVVELRKGSTTGAKISVTASINSTRKIITLTPDSTLDKNSIYYVIVNSGSVFSADDLTVSRTVSYFTTTGALVPTIIPENAATNVSSDDSIQLVFDEPMYRASGSDLTADYIQTSAIELRKLTSTGTKITYSAFISSDKKSIILTPDVELDKSTKYYVNILSSTIANSKGNVNERQTYYFTTAATLSPVITPANAGIKVPTSSAISIAFSEVLYRAASTDTTINSSYVKTNVVELRKASATGEIVDYEPVVSSDKKKITITPTEDLEPDIKYYVVILKDSLANASGIKNAKITSYFTTSEVLVPEITPLKADDDVATTTNISVTFDEPIYKESGSTITSSYIEDTAIELRSGSVDGSFVAFTATLSTDKQTFTLTPTAELNGLTTYYVIINRGIFINSAKEVNPRIVSTFTTSKKTDTSIVFTPANNSVSAAVNSKIVIQFGSPIYKFGGGTILSSYIKSNCIALRKKTSTGTLVPFTAAMSTDKQTITITPDADFDLNTKYYVQILTNSIQYAQDNIIPATMIYFTTNDGTPQISTFTSNAVTATSADIVLQSDTDGTAYFTVTSADGEYTENYTKAVLKNVPVILSTKDLLAETKYMVTSYVKSSSALTSANKTLSFTTKPALGLSITEYDDDSAKINVQYGAAGTLDIYYTDKTTNTTVNRLTGFSVSAPGTRDFDITGLNQDTVYSITVVFSDTNENDSTKTVEVTTDQTADYLSLSKLEIIDGTDVYDVKNLNYSCSASIERTSIIKIRPTVSAPDKVTITVKGATVTSGGETGNITVTGGTQNEVQIVIKAKDSSNSVTYTLSINVA